MKLNKKFGLILTFLDILVIVLVLVIKSNSTVDVKMKDTKAAANVLFNSEEALDSYKNQEIQEYIDARPVIVYDNMTMDELSEKLNRVLHSTMGGKGNLIATYTIENGVDPYLATAIILLETGCNSTCSSMVNSCNNVGGMKGSGCGAYASFPTLDDGIKSFIDNLNRNYYKYGLTTPETMGPKYAESKDWPIKVNNYINKIRSA